MNITVLTSGDTVQAHLSEAYRTLDDRQRRQLNLVVIDWGKALSHEMSSNLEQKLAEADFLLLDAHGVQKETIKRLSPIIRRSSAHTVPVGSDSSAIRPLLRLGSLTSDDLPARLYSGPEGTLPSDRRTDYNHYLRITEYWRGGGGGNLHGLLCLAGRQYGGCDALPEPADPVYVSELCIFDPVGRTSFPSWSTYKDSRGYLIDRPTVALFFLGNGNPEDTADCVGEIMRQIEAYADVLPIAFPSVMNFPLDRLYELLYGEGRGVSLIVSFLPFRLGTGPSSSQESGQALAMLETLAAPLLHPFFLSGMTVEEWKGSGRGLTPSQLLVQVVLPELDGGIETYPVAALQQDGEDSSLGVALNRLTLINERTERLVGRIRKWLVLHNKPNRDKRIALVCYNYPPGEANVFEASFLDTFESVSRLLTELKRRGYTVEDMSAAELRSRFMNGGLVNSGKWTDESAAEGMLRYTDPAFTDRMKSKEWGREAISRWGEPPGDIMTEAGSFLLPGVINGNIFIGLQPSRGIHENPEQSIHDRSLLPTHQYTAFYEWIRDVLEADAILHIGTHGTLEFQRGKEAGLSGDCIPDDLIRDLPHLYYYYVGNPSEAMIAKRRSHAVLIGYQSPHFTEAELYGEWLDLEALLHEYRDAEQVDPDRCPDIIRKMQEHAEVLHCSGTSPEEIEEELYRMRRSLIPHGLHVLGDAYSPDAAAAHMLFVLRHERRNVRSLRGLLAERRGWNADALGPGRHAELLHELDREAEALVAAYIGTKRLPLAYESDPPELREAMLGSLEYGYTAYESTLWNEEMEGMLRALEGKYVPANLAGDMLRSPEVLPSGRNLYQFDPRAVPSPTAAERGAAVAESSIRQYKERHGKYPRTTAVVLWGLETSRTQGETVGQIFHYLGVRVSRGSGAFRTDYEIIPLQELGRPRLNVVVHMTGIFRDMFPNLIEDLNHIFQRVTELDEPEDQNLFKAHSRKTEAGMLEAGYDQETAADLAGARIFGPAEGQYGTTVGRLMETKSWDSEEELGQAYSASQQHIYSRLQRGRPEPELYRSHLQAVDIVSQIRSNHEHEVIDSDHYYEYFGGLSKSVELAGGNRAEIHISDTTGEKTVTESAKQAIARGVRTRLTNPKWIDALLQHPYHGTQQIARRFDNVLGLAATTGSVEPWVFDNLHSTYVKDEGRSRQMEENNHWAYHHMIETLLETYQRGYWNPADEDLELLRRKYIELEGVLET